MSIRKMRAVTLAAAVFLTLLVVPMAAPAQANHSGPATVCAVAGAVDVDASGQLPPGGPTAGTYTFFDVAIVCAGGLTGAAGADSNGFTGLGCGPAFPVPGTFGQFCGGYSTDAFQVGGACSGNVGGPGLWNTQSPTGPWSLTLGPVITGWIDCNGHGGSTSGAIALVAVPIAPNTQANAANPDGGAAVEVDVDVVANNKDCPDSGPADFPDPIPDATPEPQVWFCRILVAGVAVLVG